MSKTLIIIVVVLAVLLGVWYVFSGQGINTNTYTPSAPAPVPTPAKPQSKAYRPLAAGQGRVVFAVKDAVNGSMQNVSSVMVTVDRVEAHSATQGWVTVSTEQKKYDLLKLKQSGSAALLADVNLPADTYNQIRLNIRMVEVQASSTLQEAKLPSHTLHIIGNVVVKEGKTATVTIDFLADKSLHITGNGTFILTPVVRFETRSDTDAEVKSDESVEINGGNVEEDKNEGMDEKGDMKANFELKGNLNVDSDGVIKIKSGTEGVIKINL